MAALDDLPAPIVLRILDLIGDARATLGLRCASRQLRACGREMTHRLVEVPPDPARAASLRLALERRAVRRLRALSADLEAGPHVLGALGAVGRASAPPAELRLAARDAARIAEGLGALGPAAAARVAALDATLAPPPDHRDASDDAATAREIARLLPALRELAAGLDRRCRPDRCSDALAPLLAAAPRVDALRLRRAHATPRLRAALASLAAPSRLALEDCAAPERLLGEVAARAVSVAGALHANAAVRALRAAPAGGAGPSPPPPRIACDALRVTLGDGERFEGWPPFAFRRLAIAGARRAIPEEQAAALERWLRALPPGPGFELSATGLGCAACARLVRAAAGGARSYERCGTDGGGEGVEEEIAALVACGPRLGAVSIAHYLGATDAEASEALRRLAGLRALARAGTRVAVRLSGGVGARVDPGAVREALGGEPNLVLEGGCGDASPLVAHDDSSRTVPE